MKFKDRDVMDWLHEIRKRMKEEREKRHLSEKKWLKEITKDAEKILGHKIKKFVRKSYPSFHPKSAR